MRSKSILAALFGLILTLGLIAPLASTQATAADEPTIGSDIAYDRPRGETPEYTPGGTVGTASAESIPPAPYPLANTFTLNSRPNATKTLYLDFNGGAVANSVYTSQGTAEHNPNFPRFRNDPSQPFTFPAWSINGDSAINDNERQMIQLMWASVAEMYAPWDINVTTQAPVSTKLNKDFVGDPEVGVSALIYWNESDRNWCGCGGQAQPGSLDADPNFFNQRNEVLVITKPRETDGSGSGTGLFSWAEISNVIGHEVGHWFTLRHDGNSNFEDPEYAVGSARWTPLMGDGPGALQHWTRAGEYPNGTNSQDDTAILGQIIGLVPDDHADNFSAATPIGYGFTPGVIGTREDFDTFRVVHSSGTRTVTVKGNEIHPALDIRLRLFDKNGQVAVSDPDMNTGPYFITPPPVGTNASLTYTANPNLAPYYVTVEGVGRDAPGFNGYSDYGSLGGYRVQLQ